VRTFYSHKWTLLDTVELENPNVNRTIQSDRHVSMALSFFQVGDSWEAIQRAG